jgi:tetratricopeptide (TPR) repeat protein
VRRSLSDLAAAVAWGAVACAVVGAIHAADPEPLTAIGGVVGALLAAAGRGTAPRSRLAGAALGLLPLWLPPFGEAAGRAASAAGTPALGFLAAAAGGALLGRGLRGDVLPRGRALALSGAAAGLFALLLLPRVGAAAIGAAGAVALLGLPGRGARSEVEPPALAGAAPGLVAGALFWVLDASSPWLGPDPWLPLATVAGGLLGAGLSSAARPRLRWVVLPALLAAGLVCGPLVPAAMERAAGLGGAAVALPPIAAAAFAFGAMALAGPPGRGSGPAAAAILLGWLVGPLALGASAAAAGAVGAVAVAGAGLGLQAPELRARLAGVAGMLGGLAVLALPPPSAGAGVAQPWRLGAEPAQLSLALREGSRHDLVRVDGPRGSWIAVEGGRPRVLAGHRSVALNAEAEGADRFFAHLAGLLGEAPRRSLLLGGRQGAVVDALRRGTAGNVDVALRPSGAASTLLRHGAWNRDVFADPGVRVLTVDPLAGGRERWDAILLELPPPWAPGAPAAWSAARLRSVATHLEEGGHAVIRLPLDELSSEDLRAWLDVAAGVFPGLFAWLDPTGAANLLVVGQADDGLLDAGAVFRAFSRRAVADDLRAAALRDPVDVLERGLADRRALTLPGGRTPSPTARAARAGVRARRGRRGLALAALVTAGVAPQHLFDLRDVPPERRAEIDERLAQAGRTRADYLALLGAWQDGRGEDVLLLASKMAEASADPTKDLRAVVAPWVRRGDAFRAQGLLDQAQAEYLVARSFSPADPELNLKLGDVQRLLGRNEEAQAAYDAVLAREPRQLEATFGVAALHAARGELAEAASLLDEAQALHPGSAPLLVNLGWLHVQLSDVEPGRIEQHLARARVAYQRATALEPRRPQGWGGLALVYERQGDFERALAAVERALALDGGCVYRGQRGGYLGQLGRLDEARAELQRAILDCPEDADALNALGAVEARQARWYQARDAWTRSLRIDPDHAAAKQNLAELEASGALELETGPR